MLFRDILFSASKGGGGSASTIIGQDDFAGTIATGLSSHTPDVGGSWTEHITYAAGSALLDGSGGIYTGVATSLFYISATPPSADYYVQTVLLFITDAGDSPGVVGRVATGANTFYYAIYDRGSESWYLYKVVAGVSTELGSSGEDFATGSRTLRLVMAGNQISVKVDNVTVIGPITDSAITAAGKAGVIGFDINTAATGIHPTAFIAAT